MSSRQVQRSKATRHRLVEAGIEVLIANGVAAFNFVRVCKAAALSRGAVHHHYHSANALLADIVREIYARLSAHVLRNLIPLGASAKVEAIVTALWSQLRTDLFRVLLEMRATAAMDAELAGIITQLDMEITRQTVTAAARSGPLDHTQIRLLFAALTGMAVQYFALRCHQPQQAERYAEGFLALLSQNLTAAKDAPL